ncbi:hypothetical protein D3C76_1683730 [compost metagenome]
MIVNADLITHKQIPVPDGQLRRFIIGDDLADSQLLSRRHIHPGVDIQIAVHQNPACRHIQQPIVIGEGTGIQLAVNG